MSTEDIEDIFNINSLLMELFFSIQDLAEEKKIEIIFNMNATLPRNLRGNPETLLQILTSLVIFVLQNSDRKEIVLSLTAPEDFLYEELISFKIQDTNIDKAKISTFLESNLTISRDLKILNGTIDHVNTSDIHLSIPCKNIELGFRRHYRLPDKTMVGKKILLFCANDKTAQSIKKMFEYFLYDVDMIHEEFNKYENSLANYDILLISEKIITEEFKEAIIEAQEHTLLKDVLLNEPSTSEDDDMITNLRQLTKPVTQEKIFDLIIEIF